MAEIDNASDDSFYKPKRHGSQKVINMHEGIEYVSFGNVPNYLCGSLSNDASFETDSVLDSVLEFKFNQYKD